MLRPIVLLAVVAAALAIDVPARAQIIAPPLEKRAIEVGYAYKWFDRHIDSDATDALKWEAASLFARAGVGNRLTLVAEGGLWDVEAGDPERTYSRWVVGGGAVARAWARQRWSLDAHVTYNEIFDLDESAERTDHRTYGWNAGLMLNGAFALGAHRVDLYAGPMYVDDVAEVYPFSGDDPVRSEPSQHWGACAGVYGVVFEYVSGFAYVLYVDEPQLRLGAALRSRGEK